MGLFQRVLKKRGGAVQERYLAPLRPMLHEGEVVIQVAVAREPNGDPRVLIHIAPTDQKRVLWYYRDRPNVVRAINLNWLRGAGMNREGMLVRLVEAPVLTSQLGQPGGGVVDVLWELLPSPISLEVMLAIQEQVGGKAKMDSLGKQLQDYLESGS
jgi:hypothetical protein